jgi:hypothetical protein
MHPTECTSIQHIKHYRKTLQGANINFFFNHLAAILKGKGRSGLIVLTCTHHQLNAHSKQYTNSVATKYQLMFHPHTKLQAPVVHKSSKQHV